MFEKLKQKALDMIAAAKAMSQQKLQIQQERIASFHDELAEKTSWSPLKSGGTNFKTHNLIKQSASQMHYKLTIGTKIFIAIFGIIGLAVFVGGLFLFMHKSAAGAWFMLLFGIIFSTVSFFMYKSLGKPIVFDGSMGFMYKGFKPPSFSGAATSETHVTYFNDIHAIQIIREYIRSNKSSYYSYELNFVLKDASRVNVIDHGNYPQIVLDAKEIAQFINKPVWDGVI